MSRIEPTSMDSLDSSGAPEQPALLPLTPSYEPSNHEVYFKALEDALTGKNRKIVRNIALTGSYGVGKSSILQRVAEVHGHKVVQVSLSTLGLSDETATVDPAPKPAVSKTNRIQKEIVKQLLYREDPVKMPGSRYKRIGRFKFWRGLRLAVLAALALVAVFFLTGWTTQVVDLVKPTFDPGLWVDVALFILFTAFIFALEAAFHNRLQIEKFTAGSTTVSLSPDTATYFDEYLDEIVYFFDVTGHDLVIFEDIDRFDDPHIFETLRALNTLLNGAKQLKGRNIRFIYAIKDSIFDQLGARAALEEGGIDASKQIDAADTELARANRTKFFDLVIPVVPFITHRSARDLMVRVMGGIEHRVSQELIDLAARHLADMRLIKNVRNEFVIFRQKILFDKESVPGLTEDQLFAMMLYKSTHLSDFEAIKSGQSKLDDLYQAGRSLVSQNIARLNVDERTERRRISKVGASAARSAKLGNALIVYIERMFRIMGATAQSRTLDGQAATDDELRTPQFWEKFLSAEIELIVAVRTAQGYSQVVSFNRADLAEALGDPLSLQDWQEIERVAAQERIAAIRRDRELLSHADMSDLMDYEEFKLDSSAGESKSFRQLADVLDSELARQLVEAGYINRDFTLFTSTYYAERVSSQATNFIIHNVDPNVTDAYFALTSDDVEAVLRERGDSVLRERGIYNIDVLDHLLEANDARAEVLVRTLTTFGEDEQSFLQIYLTSGREQESLIRFLVSQAELDDRARSELINAALDAMVDGINYVADEDVRSYFEENYSELAVFTSDATSAEAASLISRLLASMEARLGSLTPLGIEVKRSVVAESRYTITGDNLVAAIGGIQDLTLDSIREHASIVYNYVLDHLPDYLNAIREIGTEPTTIRAVDAFEAIIEDVLEHAQGQLREVVASASPECKVVSLTGVPENAWPVLAEYERFPATFENATDYIASVGQLDASLAQILVATGSITVPTAVKESEREDLAASLLAASDVLPDADTRVSLVVSLGLSEWLPVALIRPEQGQLIGLRVAKEIIEDDAASFALALGTDWATREFAISKSKMFASFMTPTEVPVGDVATLLRSGSVPTAVKEAVVERMPEFTAGAIRATLTAVAEYAAQYVTILAIEDIARLATAQVPARLVVRLLESLLSGLSLAEVAPILESLGGDYAKVAQRNGKRPTLPNTTADLALVRRLEELGVVNTHNASGAKIKVNMKQKFGL
jgi:hypothetical protein